MQAHSDISLAVRGRLLEQFAKAFDGVPFPGSAHLSLYQAEAFDSGSLNDAHFVLPAQDRDHTGRWQDLPIKHIVDCQHALAHLDAEGMRYYLPAVAMHALMGNETQLDFALDGLHGAISFSRHHPDRLRRARFQFETFSEQQLQCVAELAESYFLDSRNAARWREVAEAGWPAP